MSGLRIALPNGTLLQGCCDALLRRESHFAAPAPLRVGWADGQARAAVALAQRLRERGLSVAADLDATAAPAAGVHAYVDSNGEARWHAGAAWRSGTLDAAVEALAAPPATVVETTVPALEPRGA